MKKWVLLFMLLSYSQNIFCKSNVLFFNPLISYIERNSFLRVNSTEWISYSAHYLRARPSEANVKSLLDEFELAQKYFLVKTYNLARIHYEKVINMQDLDDWKDEERKIIFLSYVRLSEIDPLQAGNLLSKAVAMNPDFEFQEENLPKDILNKLKQFKNEVNAHSVIWPIQSYQKDFSYIILNGHVVDIKKFDKIRIPSGQYRLIFLSDVFKPQTYYVTSQQILFLEPTRIPFVSGDCKKPEINQEGEDLNSVGIYFSENCIRFYKDGIWQNLEKIQNGQAEMDVKSVNISPTVPFMTEYFNAQEEPFYKKKWFWILAGSLLAGYLIYFSQQKDSKPQNTTVTF